MNPGLMIGLISFVNFVIFYAIDVLDINVMTGDVFAMQILLGLFIFIITMTKDVNVGEGEE